jgi:simple sugar transport system permease protein
MGGSAQSLARALKRLRPSRNAAVGLIAIFLGLVAGAVLMLLTGSNPLSGFLYMFQGGLMSLERFGNTLATATPLVLTGLSVAFAFRTGLFNIGATGQLLMGGFAATALGLTLDLPQPLFLIVITLAAAASGALWGMVPGWLKARFNVHEVVSTIMMNAIASWIIHYAIPAWFKANQETQSRPVVDAASYKVPWLTALTQGSYLNLSVLIAIGAAVTVAIILNKSAFGFELKAVGFNRHAAEYGGISVKRSMVLSMMIAGALAGLAGASHFVGYSSIMSIEHFPTYGFDGIAVALLGANTALGVAGAALFFALLQYGKGFMGAMTSIPPEIGDSIIATIIYFAATSVLIQRILDGMARRRRSGGKEA